MLVRRCELVLWQFAENSFKALKAIMKKCTDFDSTKNMNKKNPS